MKMLAWLTEKIKSVLKHEGVYREPRPFTPHTRTRKRPDWKPSKHVSVIAWCRNFNARNGDIVPSKSPESIYYKTRGKKR